MTATTVYAQLDRPTDTFTTSIDHIQFLAAIIDVAARGVPVKAKLFDDSDSPAAGTIVEGVARHIVAPDHHGFVTVLTPDTRLRITGMFEHFVPLGHIEAITDDI